MLHEQATGLLIRYMEHKDSKDEMLRRRVTVDLDRFLMENREVAIQAMISHLAPKRPWYKRKEVRAYASGHKINS